ncbi:MAG: hypothetical protein R3F43_21655 [bacterium]
MLDPEAVPPWQALAVGDATLGAARPEGPPDGAAVALCAEATGFTATRDDFEASCRAPTTSSSWRRPWRSWPRVARAGLVLTRDPRRPRGGQPAPRRAAGSGRKHQSPRGLPAHGGRGVDAPGQRACPHDLLNAAPLARGRGGPHRPRHRRRPERPCSPSPWRAPIWSRRAAPGWRPRAGWPRALSPPASAALLLDALRSAPELACLDAAVIPSAGTTITLAGGGPERTTGAAFGVEAEVLRVSADSATLAPPCPRARWPT